MKFSKWKKVIFAALILFNVFLCSKVIAQTIPPKVSEAEGWKIDKVHSRTAQQDKKKQMWIKTGEAVSKGRSGPITVVFRSDVKGNAEIWADKNGIHFFDSKTGKTVTPIDMSECNYLFGPNLNYPIDIDPEYSFFAIQWHKSKMAKGKGGEEKFVSSVVHSALLDSKGNILWKKTDFVPTKGKNYIAGLSVSVNGEVLAAMTSDPDVIGELQIWDRAGEKIASLPIKDPQEFSWSRDGKNILCKWGPILGREPGGRFKFKSSVFDQKGNWVSGDR